MPRESFPAGIRTVVMSHDADFANAATVGPDFNANTLVTVAGPLTVGVKTEICGFRFKVGPEALAGAGGTLTFEVRKNSSTGTAVATITIPLASGARGAVIEGTVNAVEDVKLKDTDTLYLVRLATGTVFTTARGRFEVIGWQRPQARR